MSELGEQCGKRISSAYILWEINITPSQYENTTTLWLRPVKGLIKRKTLSNFVFKRQPIKILENPLYPHYAEYFGVCYLFLKEDEGKELESIGLSFVPRRQQYTHFYVKWLEQRNSVSLKSPLSLFLWHNSWWRLAWKEKEIRFSVVVWTEGEKEHFDFILHILKIQSLNIYFFLFKTRSISGFSFWSLHNFVIIEFTTIL